MPPVRSRDREALCRKLAKSDVDKQDKDANSGQGTGNHDEVQPKLEGAIPNASTGSDVKDVQSKGSTTTYAASQSAAEIPPKLGGAVAKASKSPDIKNAQSKDPDTAASAVPQSDSGVPTTPTTATPKSAAGSPTTAASPALQTTGTTRPGLRTHTRGGLGQRSRASERWGNLSRSDRPVPVVREGRATRKRPSRPSRGHKPRNSKGAVLSSPDKDSSKATQANKAVDSKADTKGPGVHTITKQHEGGDAIAPVLLDNTLPITKTLKKFKSGDPDPAVVTNMLERTQARTQKFANTQSAKKVKTSNRVTETSSPRKPSLSPEADAEDFGSDEDILDQFHENKLVDGKWFVQPIDGDAFPKRPEYSTWCQEGDECHGLKSFNCLMRHDYQADYWFKRKANLSALPVDPDGLGSRDPPCKHDDKPLKAPKRRYHMTGYIKGAATDTDWAKAKSGARFGRR